MAAPSLPESSVFSMPEPEYPVPAKQAAGLVDGTLTEVMVLVFTDKIMVTITQEGRLAQWIQVPMDSTNPALGDNYLPSSDGDDMLPMPHLSAKTLLGGASEDRETMGQLYATQIASAIATKNPEERRMILFGFGFLKAETSREQFFDLMELVTKCL